MNTANLQLEGVYAILAALFGALRDKGALGQEEIDALLVDVELSLANDPLRPRDMRDSNVEAICFPARLLRLSARIGRWRKLLFCAARRARRPGDAVTRDAAAVRRQME
jgi:hypothetical protein